MCICHCVLNTYKSSQNYMQRFKSSCANKKNRTVDWLTDWLTGQKHSIRRNFVAWGIEKCGVFSITDHYKKIIKVWYRASSNLSVYYSTKNVVDNFIATTCKYVVDNFIATKYVVDNFIAIQIHVSEFKVEIISCANSYLLLWQIYIWAEEWINRKTASKCSLFVCMPLQTVKEDEIGIFTQND